MSIGTRPLILVLLLTVAAAISLLSAEGTEAADIDLYGDWVISGGIVQETGKTIDVRGNVVIQSGGVLKLTGCILSINASVNGQYSLEVQSGGRLEAYGTTIEGNDAYVNIWFRDDAVLEGSRVEHVNGAQSGGGARGIMVAGHTVTMTDTVISDCRYHGIYAQADLNLDNVTIEDVDQSNVYMSNWGGSAGDFTVSVRDSTFHGSSAGGWYGSCIHYSRWGSGSDMDLTVIGSTFDGGARGVYLSGATGSDVVVDDCDFLDMDEAISMSSQTSGGDFTISNNRVNAHDLADSAGLTLIITDAITPTLVGNHVEHVHTAYSIIGPWTGSASADIGNLTVDNCTRGMVVDRSLAVRLHNSSFTHMAGGLECFMVDNGATIAIRDTDHPWGSGTVSSGNSWIRAYTDISVLGAKWRDGNPIGAGELVLENVTQFEVARINLSDPHPIEMVGWEVTSSSSRTSLYLYPAMYMDGHGFRGDRIDLRTYRPAVLELVDDYTPSLTVGAPDEGEGFNTTTVVCSGSIDELGSGLDMIERSLDGEAFIPLTTWTGDSWNLALTSLTEGEHTLALRPRDKVGNVGQEVTVGFQVDTVAPTVELDPYDELVNTTVMQLTGTTEPGSVMKVGGVPTALGPDGSFTHNLTLIEGENHFPITVVDKAGNSASALVTVTCDITLPYLAMASPDDDVWTNARWVNAEGAAEPGCVLRVNDQEVDLVNGTYKRRVDLVEGDFTVRVTATDAAGNTAEKVRTLHVDWTAPVLEIVAPEEPEVYVKESSIYISGDVDDPTIDHVMVNDQSVPLTSGRFVKQFTVLEGITEFTITVTDAADNSASVKVVVIRDLTPPSYESEVTALGGELVYVDGKMFSTAPAVEFHLTIDEVSIITVDGTEMPPGTEVRQQFTLSEGVNDIDIYVKDMAGNSAQTYSLRVSVDTTAPSISVQSPQAGYRTKEDTVTIHGFSEEGVKLTLNGETVNVLSGGEFRHIVALIDGRNEFTLEAKDGMGNTNTTSLSVLREGDVQTDGGDGGSTVTGFVLGLVVGIVVMAVIMYARGRGGGPEERQPPSGPQPPEPREPFRAPPEPGAEDAGSEGGWEEY